MTFYILVLSLFPSDALSLDAVVAVAELPLEEEPEVEVVEEPVEAPLDKPAEDALEEEGMLDEAEAAAG